VREVKFRVWFELTKKMEYYGHPQLLEQGDEMVFSAEKYFRKEEGEEFVLMQFTGLLDKNGKEIYEGYIVQTIHGNGFIGTYEVKQNSYGWSPFNEIWNGQHAGDICEFEVIGNIYENPELLKGE